MKIRYLFHIVFWLLSFALCTYLLSYDNNWSEALFLALTYLPITIVAAYLISTYLIPHYLLKGKKGLFFLYVAYVLIIAIYTTLLINTIVFMFVANYRYNLMPPATRDFAILNTVLFLIVFLFVTINSVEQWRLAEQEKNRAIESMAQAELRFLKSQLNPHFLFNTMNNLYALSLKKSDKAPELILKLSALLEYILENSKNDLIDLKDEISILDDYIYVESFRFGDRLIIEKENSISSMDSLKIPPLLLITLMENCFKHGGKNNTGKIIVNYSFQKTDDCMQISFSNNFIELSENSKAIGLQNMESQLSYIYKDKYEMKKTIADGHFTIDIKIPAE